MKSNPFIRGDERLFDMDRPDNLKSVDSVRVPSNIEENYSEPTVKLDSTEFFKETKSSRVSRKLLHDEMESEENIHDEVKKPIVDEDLKDDHFETAKQNETNDTYKRPELEIQPDNSKKTNDVTRWQRFKAFCRRHKKAIIAIALAIIVIVILFIIDRNMRTVNLTIPAGGIQVTLATNDRGETQSAEVPVRVLAYNADMGAPNELLYYIDTTATVWPSSSGQPDSLSVHWGIPDTARHRSTYNEVCLRDDGKLNKDVNNYCTSMEHVSAEVHYSRTDSNIKTDVYNKVSCTYYVPANTVGLVAWLSGWDKLDQEQLVGCAGNVGKSNDNSFSSESFINSLYGFASGNLDAISDLVPDSGRDSTGITIQNFFQSILNGQGSDIYAGDIINNSLSSNFTYDKDTNIINLSPTGVTAGRSCTASFTRSIDRPAPMNGSDNTTIQSYTCVPVFNVDRYGRLTGITSRLIRYDAVVGNEVVGVTGSNSGLVRSGAGTFVDPYTLAININSRSLKIDDNQIAIVAPQCTAKQAPQVIDPTGMNTSPTNNPDTSKNKLQWTYDADGFGRFTCVHDEDNQQLDIDTTETTRNNPNGVNTENTYTVSLSGDNASAIQFIDRNTDDQQLTHSQSTSEQNNVITTTTNVYLSGDNPSSIQFINTDTYYTASYGITIDNGDHTIGINSPTCGGNTQVLTWNGTAFVCRSGTDFNIVGENSAGYQNIGDNSTIYYRDGTGTYSEAGATGGLSVNRLGSDIYYSINNTGVTPGTSAPTITPTSGGSAGIINIPTFTVNSQGQLTATGTSPILSVSNSDGLVLDGNGVLRMPGISNISSCTAAGQGLSWDGSTFGCTTAYNWTVDINSVNSGTVGTQTGSGTVAAGQTLLLRAGNGLTISQNARTITYAVNAPTGCAATYWTGSAFACTSLNASGTGLSVSTSTGTVTYTFSASAIAGNGLTVNNGILNIGAGNGITVSGNTVSLNANTSNGGLVWNGSAIQLKSCSAGQIMRWNGGVWTCDNILNDMMYVAVIEQSDFTCGSDAYGNQAWKMLVNFSSKIPSNATIHTAIVNDYNQTIADLGAAAGAIPGPLYNISITNRQVLVTATDTWYWQVNSSEYPTFAPDGHNTYQCNGASIMPWGVRVTAVYSLN